MASRHILLAKLDGIEKDDLQRLNIEVAELLASAPGATSAACGPSSTLSQTSSGSGIDATIAAVVSFSSKESAAAFANENPLRKRLLTVLLGPYLKKISEVTLSGVAEAGAGHSRSLMEGASSLFQSAAVFVVSAGCVSQVVSRL